MAGRAAPCTLHAFFTQAPHDRVMPTPPVPRQSFRLAALAAAALIAAAGAPARAAPPAEAESPEETGVTASGRPSSITTAPGYVALEPLLVSTRSARGRGLLKIVFGVEFADPADAPRLAPLKPRLRNAHMAAMLTYAGAEYRYGDLPDAARIAALLQRATDRTLGAGEASVLLDTVQLQDE